MKVLTNAHVDLLELCVLHTNNLHSRHSMSIPLNGIQRILEKQIRSDKTAYVLGCSATHRNSVNDKNGM